MVSGKTAQRKAVVVKKSGASNDVAVVSSTIDVAEVAGGRKKICWGVVILVFLTAFAMAGLISIVVMSALYVSTGEGEPVVGECPSLNGVVNSNECAESVDVVQKVDFQPVVDEWVNSVSGRKGIIIYDLMTGDVVGEYNADEKFATASVYKLFVVYAGYLKIVRGEWASDDVVRGTDYTIGECLDKAIRESHSICAESLWDMMGREWLNTTVQEDFGLSDVNVGSFTATPREVMRMMLKYYQHSEISNDDLAVAMMDSFLNQPKTIYDWRQGLPSGFSDAVRVYNKVGWEYDGSKWLIYNDAAIVSFTDAGRDFVVVVMTSGVDYKQIVRFGRDLETKFYDILSFEE